MSWSSVEVEIDIKVDSIISGDFGSFQIKETRGEGVYGRVIRCTDLSTNKDVAMKISGEKWARITRHEANLLQNLRSLSNDKNVVEFITSFTYQGHFCLVMEHLDQSMNDLMKRRHYKPLHISDICFIAQQLLVTFNELAKRKLVHGDLKPDNIMLVNHKFEPFRIKLIDFGLSTTVRSLVPGYIIQAIGYRAPEVCLGTKINEGVDMWSLGCVLGFLYQGQNIFPVHCEYEMMRIITQVQGMPDVQQLKEGLFTDHYFNKKCGRYEMCSSQEYTDKTGVPVFPSYNFAKNFTCLEDMMPFHPKPVLQTEKEDTKLFFNLLNQILQVNPAKRITPEKALTHPFITGKAHVQTGVLRTFSKTQTSDSNCEQNGCTAGTNTNKTKKFTKKSSKATQENKGAFNFDFSSEDESTPPTSGLIKTRKTLKQAFRVGKETKESDKSQAKGLTKTRGKKIRETSHPSVIGRTDLSCSSSGSEDDCESCTTINKQQNNRNTVRKRGDKTDGKETSAPKTYIMRPVTQNEGQRTYVGGGGGKWKKESLIRRIGRFFRDIFCSGNCCVGMRKAGNVDFLLSWQNNMQLQTLSPYI